MIIDDLITEEEKRCLDNVISNTLINNPIGIQIITQLIELSGPVARYGWNPVDLLRHEMNMRGIS